MPAINLANMHTSIHKQIDPYTPTDLPTSTEPPTDADIILPPLPVTGSSWKPTWKAPLPISQTLSAWPPSSSPPLSSTAMWRTPTGERVSERTPAGIDRA